MGVNLTILAGHVTTTDSDIQYQLLTTTNYGACPLELAPFLFLVGLTQLSPHSVEFFKGYWAVYYFGHNYLDIRPILRNE